jgi:hypothetical protein
MMVIHLVTFLVLHTGPGRKILNQYKHNYVMNVVQNSMKGLGNSHRMIALIESGISKRINPYYFMMMVAARSMASTFFKETALGLSLEKPVNYNCLRMNLYEMGIPTILLYLSMQTEMNEVHLFL